MFYDLMKAKSQKFDRERTHLTELSLVLASMFDYTGLPETVDVEHIELYLISNGVCCLTDVFGDWIVCAGEFCDKPDVYGFGVNFNARTQDGQTAIIEDWRHNEHIVVIGNNALYEPDYDIHWRAYMMTEVDVSMKHNVINSRYTPMVVANTDQEKKQIEKAQEANVEGKLQVVVTPSLYSEDGIRMLDITDVKNSDKLQYLSHFRDDLWSDFYARYGQMNNSTSKMAQQSVDEINGSLTNSFIIPMDRIKMRRRAIERFNTLTGSDAAVDFGYVWEAQLMNLQQTVGAEDDTEDPEDTIEEGEENDIVRDSDSNDDKPEE